MAKSVENQIQMSSGGNAARAAFGNRLQRAAWSRLNGVGRGTASQWLFRVFMFLLMISAQDVRSQSGGSTYADLAPIFAKHCLMCHSGDTAPLDLRLDTFESVLKGSTGGPVVIAGNPEGSELVRRLKGTSLPRMPMTGPPFLSDREIALFERWIADGLPEGGAAQEEPPSDPASLPPAAGETVTYSHIAPLLSMRCVKCHTDGGLMGEAPEGYRLISYDSTLSSTDRARVVPGKPSASELVRRVRGQALPRMPFDGPPYLSSDEIRLTEDWVAQGARNAGGNRAPDPTGAKVRLHGTLGPRGDLDGLDLVISADTRIDKSPEPGDYVEVRGRLDATTNVRVERLRRR